MKIVGAWSCGRAMWQVIFILLVALFIYYLPVGESKSFAAQTVMVNTQLLNVRAGPSTTYQVVEQVKFGDKLVVWEENNGWYKVQTSSGRQGWVAGYLVKQVTSGSTVAVGEPLVGNRVKVSGSVVNVRSGPGTNYAVIAQVKKNTVLPVLQNRSGWYEIILPSGGRGWIAGFLVIPAPVPGRGGSERPQPVPPTGHHPVPANPGDNNQQKPVPAPAKTIYLTGCRLNKNANGEVLTISAEGGFSYSISEKNSSLQLTFTGMRPLDVLTVVKLKGELVTEGRVEDRGTATVINLILAENVSYKSEQQPGEPVDGGKLVINFFRSSGTSPGGGSAAGLKGRLIVLDAGHGGSDPGAIGPAGTREKDLNLLMVQQLGSELEQKGVRVLYTRSRDEYVTLEDRARKANEAKADIFVSIHCNANPNPAFGGTSTYYYRGEESERRVQQSRQLAEKIQAALIPRLGLIDLGVRQANFAVLRLSTMPAILIEVAHISNEQEEKMLNTSAFRARVVQGVIEGLMKYFNG